MLGLYKWVFHWLKLIYWICNVLIFHQHILLIACEPSLNPINIFLIRVAGKQWETLRFTIEVCSCMVLSLIAHYCVVEGIMLIFRFLTIWSWSLDPLFDPFCIWGNEIVRIKKLAMNNSKIFDCTMKKTSVNYRMYWHFYLVFTPCAIWKFITAICAYLCF